MPHNSLALIQALDASGLFLMFSPDSSDFGDKGHHPTTNAALHQEHIDVWMFLTKFSVGTKLGLTFCCYTSKFCMVNFSSGFL